MKEIVLTKGAIALVDDDDFEKLIETRWCLNGPYGYNKGRGLMHRFILGLQKRDPQVDHINGNKLDNRKSNLRLCNNAENQMNHNSTGGKSKYRGVIWGGKHPGMKKRPWISRIKLPGQPRVFLGSFSTEIDAAKSYNEYALKHCPEFTKLNEL